VICAGGANIFTNAYVLIRVLRLTLNCQLPIQVWHFGSDEMSVAMVALLAELGVELIDALPQLHSANSSITDGWQLKAFALLHCRFEEVLLLDADQVPTRDPAECFDWPQYRAAGAVFWPDIVELRQDNPIWAAMGLGPEQVRSFESGQLLVDKRRQWRPLSIALALNEESDRVYRMIYGDKDTFLIAWRLAGVEPAVVPHLPFLDETCLIQRDFIGTPLFQHRTNAKWSYWGKQYEVEGFQLLDACLEAIEHLRAHWNGTVFHPPDRSLEARAEEARIAAVGPLVLDIAGEERFTIELLPQGEIGRGRAADRQNWWCEAAPEGLELVIATREAITYRLSRQTATEWSGTRLRPPERQVRLTVQSNPPTNLEGGPGIIDDLLRAAGFPGQMAGTIDELTAALRLLCRTDSGALTRLRQLAAASPDIFAPLLAALDAPRQRTEARRDMEIGAFYRFVGHNGVD